ncbi:MAG: DUF6088 family protein [Phycisphaerae bacterium]|nr:DUF6088 family protein [Phycisphaerae bacterium]
MAKHLNSADARIAARIRERGEGWVFTPADFADLGSRTAVATALARRKRAGTIRQISRGIYDVPRRHQRLGSLAPPIEAVVEAMKSRDAVRVQPTGAYAANLLGLSDQVPTRIVFITDGPERRMKIGNVEIAFKHTTPRFMATAGRVSGSVIQALRWLGKIAVNAKVVRHLRRTLDDHAKQQLLADIRHAPAWIAEAIRAICAPDAVRPRRGVRRGR